LTSGPNVPPVAENSIRSAKLNDQFSISAALSSLGTLAPPEVRVAH
jgi:hypothetical protein